MINILYCTRNRNTLLVASNSVKKKQRNKKFTNASLFMYDGHVSCNYHVLVS